MPSPGFSVSAKRVYDSATGGLRRDISTVAIGSIATVLTPTTGKKFRLLGGYVSTSANASILFEDNSAATANFIFKTPVILASSPFYFDLGPGYVSKAINNVLKATSSIGSNMTGTLFYTEE